MCSLQTKPRRTTETAAHNGARNDICKYAAPPATQIGAQIKSVQKIMKVSKVRCLTKTDVETTPFSL